jgi:hypothetical protein
MSEEEYPKLKGQITFFPPLKGERKMGFAKTLNLMRGALHLTDKEMAKLTHTPLRTMKRYLAGAMVPTYDKGEEIIRQLLGFSSVGFEFLDIDQQKERLEALTNICLKELDLDESKNDYILQKFGITIHSFAAFLDIFSGVLISMLEKDKNKKDIQKNKKKILVKKDK